MPNWCSNSMTISHESSMMIDRIEEACKNGNLLEVLRPLPNKDWDYSWCVSNWGTKWDVDVSSWDREGNSITMSFDSAWGPPIEACRYAEEEWKYAIQLYFIESGCCFLGCYEDGHEYSYEYPESKKSLKRCMKTYPQDMIDALDLEEYFEFMWEDWED